MGKTIVTHGVLEKSAQQFQKELLQLPVIAAENTLKHMRGLPGIGGSRTLGEISGKFEIAPWKNNRKGAAEVHINPRTLTTHLGNCAQDFSPGDIAETIYGNLIVRGEEIKEQELPKQVLAYATAQIGESLNEAIFKAKYNENGDTTMELFDGFDTITKSEITAGNITTEKGNLIELQAITSATAMDQLMQLYQSLHPALREQKVKMYMPFQVYDAYCLDYASTRGGTPYNTTFEKTFLEGSDGRCELVPLSSKAGSKYIHVSPSSNMVYGYGNGLPQESIGIGKYSSWMLTLEAAMFFGVQFGSISPRLLMVGKLP